MYCINIYKCYNNRVGVVLFMKGQNMSLAQSVLDRYKGGQAEIQNEVEEYLYRGEIADIRIVDNSLRIRFAWLAKATEYPGPSSWVNEPNLDYSASLEIYTLTLDKDRVYARGWVNCELTVLILPTSRSRRRLDPKEVEGLQLVDQ